MITSAGKSSEVEDQFNFSMPLSIKIATYIKAPAVAYGGIIEARGDKNIANKNNKLIALMYEELIKIQHDLGDTLNLRRIFNIKIYK